MISFALLGMHIPTSIAAFFGFCLVVAIHEFGHFLFCKLFRVGTPSFSIGFGPRLISKKIGDTVFSLSAIPLGGYVEIAGAMEVGQGDQLDATRNDEYSFSRKPYYQKLLIMLGGIFFNLLLAYTIFIGLSIAKSPLIGGQLFVLKNITPDSIAALSGFQEGDRVMALNGTSWVAPELIHMPIADRKIAFLKSITNQANQAQEDTLEETAGQEKQAGISIQVRHTNGESHCATLDSLDNLELAFMDKLDTLPNAIMHGIEATNRIITNTGGMILGLFQAKNLKGIGGPVMILHMIKNAASEGMSSFFLLLGMLSTSLALFNLIPLPILDGGQILFYSIEAALGRPIPLKIRYGIHLTTVILVLALFVYLIINDFIRIHTNN